MKVRNLLLAIIFALLLFEILEYYAVSTTEFTYLEVVGSVKEGEPKTLFRVYISKPNPLPVRILTLQVALTCDGVRFYSEVKNITVASRDYMLWVSLGTEGIVRGRCRVEVSTLLTTNLLWIVGMGVVQENQSAEFDSGILQRPLLWAGWNATSIAAGKCSEVIVVAEPGTHYILRVYEEYYGQPARVLLEEVGSGNMSRIFCIPRSVSPLVVKGYYISLEDLSSGEVREQARSYPPRLKLRG